MKKTYFWTAESWGASDIPENVSDIIDTANDMIAAYLDETGDEDATAEYSVTLWDRYCTTGSLKDPKRFTKSWKVYGADGHRQRESFGPSVRYDFSDSNGIRLIDVLNADETGTNEYSIVTITRNTEQECDQEFAGQISDGIFENSKVGKVEVIFSAFTEF